MEYYHATFKISDLRVNSNSGQNNTYQLKDLREMSENLVSQMISFLLWNNVDGRDLWIISFNISQKMIFRPLASKSSWRVLSPTPDSLNQCLMR